MKLTFLLILVVFVYDGFSQKSIKVSGTSIVPSLIDSSKFNLFDNWKVIERTYITESPHANNAVSLEEINPKLFIQRKLQGEMTYGCHVYFEKNLYVPYCPYLPSLIINPKFKKKYIQIDVREGNYDPRFGNQRLLSIDVLCPFFKDPDIQIEFSILVLTSNIICIIYDNAYTYLERVSETKKMWTQDKDGYNVVNLMGSSDFEFLISAKIIEGAKSKLKILFNCSKNEDFKYTYVESFISNYCDNGKSVILFPEKNIMVAFQGEISLENLKSKVIRINGGTISQETKWQVKWIVMP